MKLYCSGSQKQPADSVFVVYSLRQTTETDSQPIAYCLSQANFQPYLFWSLAVPHESFLEWGYLRNPIQ